MAGNSPNLWDQFYNSYVNLFALLAPSTPSHSHNLHESEEIKASAEQCVMKFIDCGRSMESFFLQKRLLFASQKPEQVLMEEIGELDGEIKRKEEVIKKFYEKLELWQNLRPTQAGEMH